MGLMKPLTVWSTGQASATALNPTKSMACRCRRMRLANSISGERQRRRLRISLWGVVGSELSASEMASLLSRSRLLDGDWIPEGDVFFLDWGCLGFGAGCAVEESLDPWELSPSTGRCTIVGKRKADHAGPGQESLVAIYG